MPFATPDDISDRLGRELTDAEDTQATAMIESADALIADAVGKPEDWIAELDGAGEIPVALKALTVEVVARAIAAPIGLRSQQETLGQHSHSQSFPDALAVQGLALTAAEERRARRIVFGSNAASAKAESVIHDIYDLDDTTA